MKITVDSEKIIIGFRYKIDPKRTKIRPEALAWKDLANPVLKKKFNDITKHENLHVLIAEYAASRIQDYLPAFRIATNNSVVFGI